MTREEAIEKIKRWKLEIDDEKDYADYLEGWFYKDDEIAFDMAIEALKQPERKAGKWEEVKNADGASHDYRCSVCHRYRFHNGEMRSKYKYCPNCGARMEGGQNG